ncbi:VirB4 family type IV secretion system protein [Halosimplex pelagicum]|uniref:Transfer complex protein n=1 Tax=Halosimplex pelagicum TaxID=869886 RepID=A0A7D5TAC0_9EURY|nr:transfer complex protein [Halosimplex pelagicum]QLH81293.1 transfer complex protein [Halosimplex pelagicum]
MIEMLRSVLPTREDAADPSEASEGPKPDDTEAAVGVAGDSTGDATADVSVDYDPSSSNGDVGVPDVSDIHQTVVTPSSIEREPNVVRTGDQWAQTLWVGEYPDTPMDGLFESLYSTADTRRTDISLHISPRDTTATLDTLENTIEDLQADREYLEEKRRAGARGIEKDIQDFQALYDALRNTSMSAFDVSMYLAVQGDSKDDLNVDGVTSTARQSPTNLTPVTPRWTQLDSFVSASPVGVDKLNESLDTTTPMLAGAVGAMFPFVAGAFAEPGIEYGTYALNESPLILDRFERETGYCAMVIGQLGAGKSFSTKLQLLRRAMYDQDTVIIMLDPLEGFAGVNETLGGERITVGGTRGINPLELKATPSEVLADAPDVDPWSEQISWVLTFFETFFEHVATNPLADRKQTLRRAVQEAYDRKGITRAPSTHDRESPTIRDVMAVLEDMLDAPGEFGYATAGEQESVQGDAQSLLTDLRPSFRPGGDLANLAAPTEFDLDSSVLYLDLHQEEGATGRSETSLMMQVLFNAVYERAKGTDKRVVFAIDEAHYLMNDATSLEFLETAVRHSRHYDLSLHFITQTGGEFALTPEARTIANLCSLTLIHRVQEETEKLAEWFGLSEREVNWIRTAKAGNDEDGFSEALLGIEEEGWFPLRVRASDFEVESLDQ